MIVVEEEFLIHYLLEWVCVVFIGQTALSSVSGQVAWRETFASGGAWDVWKQERGRGGLLLPWWQEGEIADYSAALGICSVSVSHGLASQSAVDIVW